MLINIFGYCLGLIAVLTPWLSQSCDFGPLRKKLQNDPLSFAFVTVLAPQDKNKIKK